KNCVGIDLGPLGKPEVCAGPYNVDLKDAINRAVNADRAGIEATARDAVTTCDQVKGRLAEHWRPYALPLEIVPGGRLYANVTPVAAGSSGLIVLDQAVRATIRASVLTEISPTPASTDVIPLPQLEHVDGDHSNISLVVSARVPTTLLDRVLRS